MSSVNNYSAELRSAITKARPQKGQKFWFTSMKPGARGTTVLPYDTIWDPWVKDSSGKDIGAMIDIAYLTSSQPVWGDNRVGSLKEIKNLGRIQFQKPSGGRLAITGGDPQSERLFEFMYLTGQVQNTQDKDWYAPRPGRSFVCKMQEPDKTDTQKLEFNRKVWQAGQLIDEMGESKLREFASGLEMPKYNKFTSPDSIKVYLVGIAGSNPDKVLMLDKDENLKIRTLVKAALKHGIIVHDSQIGVYKWPESGDRICLIPPGEKPLAAIANYLLGDGKKAKDYISKLVNEAEADPEKKAQK